MKLLTKKILKALPRLYSTETVPAGEKIAVVKFFNPCGAATWYGVEYDPQERVFFGYVDLYCDEQGGEFGYFSLDELENLKVGFGLGVERDRYFDPAKLSVVCKNARF